MLVSYLTKNPLKNCIHLLPIASCSEKSTRFLDRTVVKKPDEWKAETRKIKKPLKSGDFSGIRG